jgi:hypothetical protein
VRRPGHYACAGSDELGGCGIFFAKRSCREFLLKEVAVDRHAMLLIGSAIVAVVIIASVMLGALAGWLLGARGAQRDPI